MNTPTTKPPPPPAPFAERFGVPPLLNSIGQTEAFPAVIPNNVKPCTTKEIAQRCIRLQEQAGTGPCIRCIDGVFAGKFFYLNKDNPTVVIGSDGSIDSVDLVIQHNVCPVHCKLTVDPLHPNTPCYVQDLSNAGLPSDSSNKRFAVDYAAAPKIVRLEQPDPSSSTEEENRMTGALVTDTSGFDTCEGVFIKVRSTKKAPLSDRQEIWFEFPVPANIPSTVAFGSSKLSNPWFSKPMGLCGSRIRLAFGAPISEEEAFNEFKRRFEIENEIERSLTSLLEEQKGDGSVDVFQRFGRAVNDSTLNQLEQDCGLEEALKVRTARQELDEFQPWALKSRPLKLIACATDEEIGEVRWTGAYIVPCCSPSIYATTTDLGHGEEEPAENSSQTESQEYIDVQTLTESVRIASTTELAIEGEEDDTCRNTDPTTFPEVSPEGESLPGTSELEGSTQAESGEPTIEDEPMLDGPAPGDSHPVLPTGPSVTDLQALGNSVPEWTEKSLGASVESFPQNVVSHPPPPKAAESVKPSVWWSNCYLSSEDLQVDSGTHPNELIPYKIPDLHCNPLWSVESCFSGPGLGLLPLVSMLPSKVPIKAEISNPREYADEPIGVRLRRCTDWINRTPQQCLSKKSMPEGRKEIRLPPVYGAGFHLTIRYEHGRYVLLETFPADSHDFGTALPCARQVSFRRSVGEPYKKGWLNSLDMVDSVWLRIVPEKEEHPLMYGDKFRLGLQTFEVLRFNIGFGGLQGYRQTMEDEEVAVQDLVISDNIPVSFFAVYDGHGGRECASFLKDELHLSFVHQIAAMTGHFDESQNAERDVFEALYRSFIFTDRAFLKDQLRRCRECGTRNGPGGAAVVVAIVGDTILCANAGDARCLISRKGKALQISLDHKPDRPEELTRIQRSGGFIRNKRVLGRLAVSRAFGDIEYKNVATDQPAFVIADPEIRSVEGSLTEDDEFMLLACDGLFDVYHSQDVVDQIRGKLLQMPPHEMDVQVVVESLVHEAIDCRSSRDNVSAILILFKEVLAL